MTSGSNWVEKVQLLGADGAPLRMSGPAEVAAVQGILTASGIESEVSEPSTAFHELPAHLILVRANQAEEASRIIAEARVDGRLAAEEAESASGAEGDRPPGDVNSGSRGIL